MDALTPKQRELARHALGLPNKKRKSYRNHFVTGKSSSDYPHWQEMVAAGFAAVRGGNELTGGDDLFRLTKKGALAALNQREHLDPEDFGLCDSITKIEKVKRDE